MKKIARPFTLAVSRFAGVVAVCLLLPALMWAAIGGDDASGTGDVLPLLWMPAPASQPTRMTLGDNGDRSACGGSCACSPCLCGIDCPCCGLARGQMFGAKVGGRVAPDGKTEIQIDLPGNLHRKNTASFGLGLCVFTSIHHSATWQNVPLLQEFPKYLIDHKIPGGGYPQKVAQLVSRIAKEKGVPEPDYIQVEGSDIEILKLACATGRMPAVTYSQSPTGRYGGQRIAHMVSLPHADDKYFAVLDNNYIGDSNYEWMTPQEFSRTYTGMGGGWAVILLDSGPPPTPAN